MRAMKPLAVAGFGKLGSAIVRGALRSGVIEASSTIVWARSEARRDEARTLGVELREWPDVLSSASTLLLALKPQVFESMTQQAPRVMDGAVVISVMGGWSAAAIGARLGTDRVIRAMPSVAASVGASTTALCVPAGVPTRDVEFVRGLFGSVGRVVEIPEAAMDAATAVGASGVGFACAFMEALERAGVQVGLEPEVAAALALGAIEGAAATVRAGIGSASQIREQVTSPGGTTAAGLAAMRAARLDEAIEQGVGAARDRAAELGARPRD
jgi:pyrroline-5-carboxylate reductase